MRIDIAYGLLAVMMFAAASVVFLTWRYQRYERRVRHGSRSTKPVWKPFWMD